jgi:hypothetical protein
MLSSAFGIDLGFNILYELAGYDVGVYRTAAASFEPGLAAGRCACAARLLVPRSFSVVFSGKHN